MLIMLEEEIKEAHEELEVECPPEFTKESILSIIYEEDGISYESRIFFEDGVLKFEGNADKSAKIFFEECLIPACDEYIKEKLKNVKSTIT